MKAVIVNDITDIIKNKIDISTYPVLFEKEKIETYDIYLKNGKHYVCCGLELSGITGEKYATLKEIEINNDNEETYEDNVTCPYCGYENLDSWELGSSDDEYECRVCDAKLSFELIVTVKYATKLIKKPNIIEI